ncbi:septum formation initiator family protein [uncultured Helcococcus sp.]|uniref:FtsB family cell division protein n=1 Tax=uncultured Helcococcus sp. TaxID=1072508 RepID=UPI002889AD0C|nr:septum formation initiator family protein [uncultured Helcococcus sp.]
MSEQRRRNMNRSKSNLRKRKRAHKRLNIILTITTVIFLSLVFTLIKQRFTINNLKKDQALLIDQQNKIKSETDQLKEEIKKSNSLEYIEQRAREELGMIKKDEKIYVNPENLNNNQESDSQENSN